MKKKKKGDMHALSRGHWFQDKSSAGPFSGWQLLPCYTQPRLYSLAKCMVENQTEMQDRKEADVSKGVRLLLPH